MFSSIHTSSADLRESESAKRYIIKVTSVSNKVEFFDYTNTILDSYNLTFQWFMPSGRVDYYIVVYNTVEELI